MHSYKMMYDLWYMIYDIDLLLGLPLCLYFNFRWCRCQVWKSNLLDSPTTDLQKGKGGGRAFVLSIVEQLSGYIYSVLLRLLLQG